ncbi:MAG: metalloregulator ArsR/SmtB family transcription factor [Candidatus Thermoplasmatota archaeon]|nr:metalloregulator ArsR/SmtB family transcription factor [Candidatus Thermoplasmatota archaeon]MCL5963359.1 metalloregulator ArsR/SmtB family transcription factor [Candidatus Thermoplasmatota archaeon]
MKEEVCIIKKLDKIEPTVFENIELILCSLSNNVRLAILYLLLKHGELCTCELETALKYAQPTITSHLHKLYYAGILKKREVWKYTYYSINTKYVSFVEMLLNMK